MAFAIFALHGEIADPDSGQPLGRWEAVKTRVVATHVQPRMCTVRASGRRRGAGGGRYPAFERDDGRALGGSRPRQEQWQRLEVRGTDVRGRPPEPAHCVGDGARSLAAAEDASEPAVEDDTNKPAAEDDGSKPTTEGDAK